mmetsp:Transcript_71459/g.140320  ORF Transcript_71459/g.140320 Transcript_71459/m.140320 type:complete len:256 (-) Transcript_71459:142-909(-)
MASSRGLARSSLYTTSAPTTKSKGRLPSALRSARSTQSPPPVTPASSAVLVVAEEPAGFFPTAKEVVPCTRKSRSRPCRGRPHSRAHTTGGINEEGSVGGGDDDDWTTPAARATPAAASACEGERGGTGGGRWCRAARFALMLCCRSGRAVGSSVRTTSAPHAAKVRPTSPVPAPSSSTLTPLHRPGLRLSSRSTSKWSAMAASHTVVCTPSAEPRERGGSPLASELSRGSTPCRFWCILRNCCARVPTRSGGRE